MLILDRIMCCKCRKRRKTKCNETFGDQTSSIINITVIKMSDEKQGTDNEKSLVSIKIGPCSEGASGGVKLMSKL